MSAPAVNMGDLANAALQLFRAGCDTVEVALRLGIPESKASRYVWVARSWERGVPADYVTDKGMVRRIEP